MFRREEKRAKIEANRRLKQTEVRNNDQKHRLSTELPVSNSFHTVIISKKSFFLVGYR